MPECCRFATLGNMRFVFTAAAERALDNASGWSLGSACDELEAESLLLGLLSEPECRAAAMLTRVGVDISVVRKQWTALTHNSPSEEGHVRQKLFSSDLVCSFQLASERLACLPQPLELTTEHILLGLTAADHDVAAWLRRQGIDPDSLAAEIRNLHGFPAEDESCQELDASDEFKGATAGQASSGTLPQQVHTSMIDTLRVIDAAANRAREGLRVIEDYARLILDDRHLTQLCKQMRHDLAGCLAAVSMDRRFAARETQADVGTTLDLPTEGRRDSPRDVLRANFARLQEALRSLEEFGKLLDAGLAAAAKQLRYGAYTLERAVGITGRSIERLASARLYVLLDGGGAPEEFERLARSLIEAGADILQLRDKRLGDRELLARARLLVAATRGSGTLAIVNDRPDLAVLAGADGVHVGQEEVSVKDARRIVGPDALVGASTHSIEQARQAVLDGADYIGIGPVFPSDTKQFKNYPGVELLRAVAAEIRLPAFAIGGINRSNIAEVLAAGAARVAVGSAVTSADDPARAAKELSMIVHKQRNGCESPNGE